MVRTGSRSSRRRPWRSWLLAVSWHRRLLAALFTAAAVAAALTATAPPTPPSAALVVYRHDLDAGTLPDAGDLAVSRVPTGSGPTGTFDGVGAVPRRALLGPVRAGVAVSDVDFVSPGLLAGFGADVVAVPVRMADAGSLGYLRVGDRIDLVAADTVPGSRTAVGSTRLVASAVPVLAITAGDATDSADGGLVVVAARTPTARAIAGAAVTARLSYTLRGGP